MKNFRVLHDFANPKQCFSPIKNTSQKSFRFIPLQDFSATSDIDWTKSIKEIDEQLFDKYGLDDAEREFIEQNIQEMV